MYSGVCVGELVTVCGDGASAGGACTEIGCDNVSPTELCDGPVAVDAGAAGICLFVASTGAMSCCPLYLVPPCCQSFSFALSVPGEMSRDSCRAIRCRLVSNASKCVWPIVVAIDPHSARNDVVMGPEFDHVNRFLVLLTGIAFKMARNSPQLTDIGFLLSLCKSRSCCSSSSDAVSDHNA